MSLTTFTHSCAVSEGNADLFTGNKILRILKSNGTVFTNPLSVITGLESRDAIAVDYLLPPLGL